MFDGRFEIGQVKIEAVAVANGTNVVYEATAGDEVGKGATISEALAHIAGLVRSAGPGADDPLGAIKKSEHAAQAAQSLQAGGEVRVGVARSEDVLPPQREPNREAKPMVMSSVELFEEMERVCALAFDQTFDGRDKDAQAQLATLVGFCVATMRKLVWERAHGAEVSALYIAGLILLQRLGLYDDDTLLTYARSVVDDVALAIALPDSKAPVELQ